MILEIAASRITVDQFCTTQYNRLHGYTIGTANTTGELLLTVDQVCRDAPNSTEPERDQTKTTKKDLYSTRGSGVRGHWGRGGQG